MKLEEVILRDTRALQPLATDVAPGTLFGVTDEGNIVERSDGTAWAAYSPTAAAGGITQLTGDITAGPGSGSQAATIANDAVTTAKILNGAVTDVKLATDSVTGAKILANAVSDTKIANDAVLTAKIINDAVTYAKMQNVSAASRLLGRGSASGAGDVEEITLGTNLSMSGTTLNATGGGGGSTSLNIAQAASPASFNVSTEGTIDWLHPNSQTQTPRLVGGSTGVPGKAIGGWLLIGFDWILPGTIFTTTGASISSSAGDNVTGTTLAAATGSQGLFVGGAEINFGFRITAPPSPNRVSTLQIICGCFSALCTATATMPFDSLSQSLTFDSGAAAGLGRLLTITYQGGSLNVRVQVTTNRGSSPNVTFQTAALK